MKYLLLIFVFIGFSGCYKEVPFKGNLKRQKNREFVIENNREYHVHWELSRKDSEPYLKVDVDAVTDSDGNFDLKATRKGVYPTGQPFIHVFEAIKTKKGFFTRLDNAPFIRWSSVVDEDRTIWRWYLGEAVDLYWFTYYCFIRKMNKCDRFNKGNLNKLVALKKPLNIRYLLLKPMPTLKEQPAHFEIKIASNQIGLYLKYSSLINEKVVIKTPDKFIPDHDSSPLNMLKNLEKALNKNSVGYSKGDYYKFLQ